jgi:hypothetical protein
MNKGHALIDRESFQPFFSLLLFCGIALFLSVPFGDRVKDFHAGGIFSGIPIYYHAQGLFMGIFGLSLGAISAAHGETGRKALLRMAERIGLAQFLTLPYLLFTWALYPSKAVEILLIVLYTTIVSALCAVGSYLIEAPWTHRSARGFLLKYAAFTGYLLLPFGFLPLLSPFGMVDALFCGKAIRPLLFGYLVPIVLLLGLILVAERIHKEGLR